MRNIETDPTQSLAQNVESLSSLLETGVVTHGLARAIRRIKGEMAIAEANEQGRKSFEINPPELKPGLHVGCGNNILDEFTNLDIFPNEGVDVVCDAREGLPFDDDKFERVFSEHMLEHVDFPRSVKSILGEMVRVTEPGGQVIVGVPDSSVPAIAYAEGDEAYFAELKERWYSRRADIDDYTHPIHYVRLVMSDVEDDPVYTPHLGAFDNDSLKYLLEEAGLTDIKPWELDPEISLEKRHWGSVYLQGTKPTEG